MNAQARRWLKPLTGLAAVGVLLAVGVGSAAAEDSSHAQLKLIKTVINDNGGTATGGDFTLYANAVDPSMDGRDFHSHSNSPSFHDVYSGVTYNLSEKGPAGYAMGTWSCDGGIVDGSTVIIPNVNRDNQDRQTQSVTCSLTNNDIAPILHLVKVVDNTQNGGSAVPTDFTVLATGNKTTDGPPVVNNNVTGQGSADSGPGLKADTWQLSESTLPGYSNGEWSCVRVGEDPTVGRRPHHDRIELGVGEEATCTVTNTSIAPQLHLLKQVTNDSGGTATADQFTMTATGTLEGNVLTGTTPVNSDGIKADTFTLSESGPAGYAGTWACDNTKPVEDNPAFAGGSSSLTGNTLLLYPGEDVTCTLTNDDIAPVLQLRKVVINDNGGVATSANFPLTATGSTPENSFTGVSPQDSTSSLKPDTWTLSEATLANYTASAWVCVGGTQIGSTVAVGIGETAVCTITNDDIAPAPAAATIAPPVVPVVAPPASVRGTATLRSSQGCIAGTMALTRLTARNVDHVVFIRDGRFVKRVNAHGKGLQAFSLATQVDSVGVHKVTARVFFVTGATPRVANLTHRFSQCRVSPPVTG